MVKPNYQAVLYDLDGTFLDTALDLGGALNQLLCEHGHEPIAMEKIRPVASHGARGLLALGFNMAPDHVNYEPLRQQYLDIYAERISRDTIAFDGINQSLTYLDTHQIPWGIVTNKPAFLTQPLMEKLGYWQQTPCIVSGDTTAKAKPSPLPLYHACELLNIAPEHCLYVGDAQRDIEAGKNAGMDTVLACYGYISEDDDIDGWNATYHIQHASEVLQFFPR